MEMQLAVQKRINFLIMGLLYPIELGKLGGLGVIPRFMPAEEEANMTSDVKKENAKSHFILFSF